MYEFYLPSSASTHLTFPPIEDILSELSMNRMAEYSNFKQGPDDGVPHHSVAQVQDKYAAERSKRLRPDFEHQFVKLHTSDQFKHFTHDPWLPADGSTHGICLSENQIYSFKFVIQGAGFGGLLYAARLVEAGFKPQDIVSLY